MGNKSMSYGEIEHYGSAIAVSRWEATFILLIFKTPFKKVP
jgi:hypothetical protein